MLTAKDKAGSASHRYRPASEYDDATLTQKRQYWRTKKREQRARLTERRGNSSHNSQGGKFVHLHAPAAGNSTLSGSFAAFSSPLQSNDDSYKAVNVSPAPQTGKIVGDSSVEAPGRKEKWLSTMELNKVLPQFTASSSIPAKAARRNVATVRGAASRAVTSHSETQLNPPSVPPVRVTGSSAKTQLQPCVSMQGASVPKTQNEAQVVLCIQPKLSPPSVTTGMIIVSSPCVPVSIKTEGQTATPQSGTESALVTTQRAKGVSNSHSVMEPEDQRAARRREQWRIKKREQRAKQAAQVAKVREKTQSGEMTMARQTAQKAGLVGDAILQHLPSQSLMRGAVQKQCPTRVKTSFTSAKRETYKLQSWAARLATVNLQTNRIIPQNPHGNRTPQTAITYNVISVRKRGETQRKLPSYVNISNVSKGIARCKTPRQRIDAQRNFMNQRNIRCKSPFLSSVFGSRNMRQIDPNDTPEQIIAKRRECWRIKKREQRAKLSMEVRGRLMEKDSLMRRVKRYQDILEEIRRSRAMAQSGGSILTNASETIGGFIKEDGTLSINIPQVSTDHNTAARIGKEEANNTPISGTTPIRVNQPPPPPRPTQVRVTFPPAGQSVNTPPRLLSIRPWTQLESTTVSQIRLTRPQTSQNTVTGGPTAGSNLGGCVMKMTVSNSAVSLSALSLDPALTEEERMAKKREYWRIKKREHRAARLKQEVLHARATEALQRRRAQKPAAETTATQGGSLTGNAQSLPNNSVPITPNANEIKQESEPVPAVDLNSQPEHAICPEISPPTSPPPPPAPQPEPDPALSSDSQATTLLAVASMKKLLEESLSTVTHIKIESKEEASQQEMEPTLPQNEGAPIAADLTLEIKSWQPDSDALVPAGSQSPHLKDAPQSSDTLPHPPNSNEVVLNPTCEHSSQTTSNVILDPSVEASDIPSSPHRTLSLPTKTESHESSCSPEPPKLHHLPMVQLQPQQQHCEQQIKEEGQNSPSAEGYCSVGPEHSGMMSLQRKREYWKLIKRQQRARQRARQRERQAECSSRPKHIQAPGRLIINTVKGGHPPVKRPLQPRRPPSSLSAVSGVPTLLVVSPTTCSANRFPDRIQVKLPVPPASRSPRTQQNHMDTGQMVSTHQGDHENQQGMTQKWTSTCTGVHKPPFLPPLKPPENPLSSINLQPIEPPHTPSSSPIKIPCAQLQSATPKAIPGESEEDFLRRKREYWRVKKKEQRARKAIREKGWRTPNHMRSILPAQDLHTQSCGQWVSSSEESEHFMSTSKDTDPASFSFSGFSAPAEDESDLLFADYDQDEEEGPVSDAVWRNRYLMDHDPLNQLLVCMVCGELQYSHSLEGVRAHIDEAHPHTLSLEPGEQRQILEAWDEQVSRRERFFTSQLQQHNAD
ncbi:uncharacterized protein si:dkey-28a3.2 [Gymnodraco acuticeps]|uniref:Uncharacterized protein si:dkey-28a3.2 n=1 Tax=Gymnodraco acuticeps TaxID=8218 RepID=A0A6P8USW6_GYMAC|nr:uncharacterized protein si:dkey-28a3.2 [Gymnodraco acuticeps]XP_034080715.1 uncharacterized protein si:dkey-28a3.2 [Gymnodraco acuticeps]XP_034080716.1 uncharacterized protein si:dkey-28a3.2 [Gymnodraco acuticeps]